MPSGQTTTGSLNDSMPLFIDSARIRREYPPVVAKLAEMHKLDANTGLSWEEVEFGRFTAQAVTDTTTLDNAQQFSDSIATVTPTISGITTIVTDKVYRRLSKNCIAQMGSLAQDALERKKDFDGLTTIDGATNSAPGAGVVLASSDISAAVANIKGNTTEGATGAIYSLLHAFQIKDLQDEIVSGLGTYAIPQGLTAEVFRKGFNGTLFGTEVYEDNNIVIDASADSKGGVFAKIGLLYVQGMGLKKESLRRPEYGGGADQIWMYDEYAYAERLPNATSVFIREIYSDTTAPA